MNGRVEADAKPRDDSAETPGALDTPGRHAVGAVSGGSKRVAVIGAGWAGCAAAVELVKRGHRVELLEASRMLGGRARAQAQPGWEHALDNGQHILLGAYRETLAMMRAVGVDPDATLLRLPLQMCYPEREDGMHFVAARLPAPLHLLTALLRADGLSGADRMALARFTTSARWIDWRLNQDCSVSMLLERFDQTPRVTALMWRPLCLAALNTPPQRASAQVFLNVLRDSLGARRAASDMLLPRVDLSALFAAPAVRFLQARGMPVRLGARVTGLKREPHGWRCDMRQAGRDADDVVLDAGVFDAVILATPFAETERLLASALAETERLPGSPLVDAERLPALSLADAERLPASPLADAESLPASPLADAESLPASPLADAESVPASATGAPAPAFSYEPITTCYLHYAPTVRLQRPFYALRDDPAAGIWGQFVFDRGQLDTAQAGLLAVVVSASADAVALDGAALTASLAAQLAAVFGDPELATPLRAKLISEKRATFACTPGLVRPPNSTALAGVLRAGDYTDGPYPATLESAVRSGIAAARMIDSG